MGCHRGPLISLKSPISANDEKGIHSEMSPADGPTGPTGRQHPKDANDVLQAVTAFLQGTPENQQRIRADPVSVARFLPGV